ncbi:Cold-shock DNA-binding domain protein [Shewanella aquimarina]
MRQNRPNSHSAAPRHSAKPRQSVSGPGKTTGPKASGSKRPHGGKIRQKGTRWTLADKLRLLLMMALFIGLLLASLLQRLPIAVFIYYVVISLITFTSYAIDKRAARQDTWRIKESRLHWLSLLGGWPGAMLGQQHLRHKSSKRAFRLVLWLTVIINLSLLGAVISPQGQALLTRLGVN